MSEEWKLLTEQDKVKYNQMHQQLKAQYEVNLQEYKKQKGDAKVEKPTKKRGKQSASKEKVAKI